MLELKNTYAFLTADVSTQKVLHVHFWRQMLELKKYNICIFDCRWKIVNNEMEFADEYIGLMSHFVLPLTIYMTWQIAYLFITGI
jgi:hypothetical protein